MFFGDYFQNNDFNLYYQDFDATALGLVVLVLMAFLVGVVMLVSFFTQAATLVSYIAKAVVRLRVSQKLGVKIGWFSFFPVLDSFLQGRLAEVADKHVRPEKRPFRWGVLMLILDLIARAVLLVVSFAYSLYMAGMMIMMFVFENPQYVYFTIGDIIGYTFDSAMIAALAVAGIFALFTLIALAYIVIYYLSFFFSSYVVGLFKAVTNFKVYRAFAKRHAVWMICADILLGSWGTDTLFYAILGFSDVFKLKELPKDDKTAPDAPSADNEPSEESEEWEDDADESTEPEALPAPEDEMIIIAEESEAVTVTADEEPVAVEEPEELPAEA